MSWRIGTEAEKEYREVIQKFLDDDTSFVKFKRNPLYSDIIGAPRLGQGVVFWRQIRNVPEIYEKLSEYQRTDAIGGAWTYTFDNHKMSLNLLRHMNTLIRLTKEFNSLDNLSIQEVGCGWGGLAHCILTRFKPKSYNVVDLTEAMLLAKKHSQWLGHRIEMGPIESPDLAIAEYSITEQFDPMPLTHELLMPAKKIFVRCNILDPAIKKEWLKLLGTKFNITIEQEELNPVPFNCIIVGKT